MLVPRSCGRQGRWLGRTAALGLLGLSTWIAGHHRETDTGVGPEDVTVPSWSEAEAADPEATREAVLVDMVEPADGEGGSEAEIAALLSMLSLDVAPATFYSHGEHLYRIEGSPDDLTALEAKLRGHPLVEGVEPDLWYSVSLGEAAEPSPSRHERFLPDDPMFALQWHLEQIHAPDAWAHSRGRGAVVAVIDTGVAYKSAGGTLAVPDLGRTYFTSGHTFVTGGLPDGVDDHAHGTHVAGTIAQSTHNGIGVAGVAFAATVMPLKVLTAQGSGSVGAIADAIRYAADHGAQVINMSLGGPLPSRVLAKAVEYAHDKGVTVVAAAGNSGRGRVAYPAAYQGALAVAAVDTLGQRTFYSNWGKHLDVSAPGGDTRVDRNNDGHPDGVLQNTLKIGKPGENDYLWFQGTSMASPHVAGVAALLVSQGVTSPDEVERLLKETAVHPAGVTWDEHYGAGVVDAGAAVTRARTHYGAERTALGALLALAGGASLGGLRLASGPLLGPLGFAAGAALAVGASATPVSPLAPALDGLWGGHGSGALLSVLLPAVLAVLFLGLRGLRGVLAGLSLGQAALLLHGGLVLPTVLGDLPGGQGWDRLWLLGNALLALLLARRIAPSRPR